MNVVRRFLVAPSLVRLIRKERGGSRITEGYFAPQAGRTSFVRIDGQHCHLVLVNTGAGGVSNEERTEVPRAHGDALIDVCSGKAIYDRTTLPLGGGRDALIDRYATPPGLDLVSVAFDDEDASRAFSPPAWFGAEVSADGAYDRHAVALQGVPKAEETALSNAALDAVLDLVEPRFGFGRTSGMSAPPPRRENGAVSPPRAAAAAAPAAAATAGEKKSEAAPRPQEAGTREDEPAAAEAAPEAEPIAGETASASEEPDEAPVESTEPAETAASDRPEDDKSDARIDDVIESLSQALGAAIQKPQEPAREDELAASFERWTVRPRRTQQ